MTLLFNIFVKVMKEECKGTEAQIREAAKKLFFVQGKLHATTQEIADAAGVNRSLLNYYFRSRDELFQQVYIEARREVHETLNGLFSLELPFKEKVAHFVDVFSDKIRSAPYAEIFMVSEINNPCKPIPVVDTGKRPIHFFLEEVEAEMEKGEIRRMEPLSFVMNMFALISHPMLLRPLYQEIFSMDQQEYNEVLQRRKEMIVELILSV